MEAGGSDRGPSERRPTSWTARILAPLVLAIVAAAIALVVSGSLDSDDAEKTADTETTTSTGCNPAADAAVAAGFYVIKPEEDLSVVADRTCISVEDLLELNENLDPQTIQVGACIDLRTDGCKALAEG